MTHVEMLYDLLPPPQAISPVWVWPNLSSGRFGRLHSSVPCSSKSSTEAEGSFVPIALLPPVMIIAEKRKKLPYGFMVFYLLRKL